MDIELGHSSCKFFVSSVLALELRQNKAKYERTAKEMTLKYASSDRQELKRVCQGQVMKSVVIITSSGGGGRHVSVL